MTPEGFKAVQQAVTIPVEISPEPVSGDDERFVSIDTQAVARNQERYAAIWATVVLNNLARAGFMETHGPRDAFIGQTPAFRVLDIAEGVVYLEDTNSALF